MRNSLMCMYPAARGIKRKRERERKREKGLDMPGVCEGTIFPSFVLTFLFHVSLGLSAGKARSRAAGSHSFHPCLRVLQSHSDAHAPVWLVLRPLACPINPSAFQRPVLPVPFDNQCLGPFHNSWIPLCSTWPAVPSSDFFRYFSLGDKLGQGASAKVFKGVIKKTKKGSPPMVCAIKRVRKFQLKDRKKQALLREVR